MSWLTGGQHQTRQPGGPWLCALLPDVPDMPVGRPRADGPVGLQLGSADTPSHHPGGHCGPLASSITATPKLAVVLRGGIPATPPRPAAQGHGQTLALASAQPHTRGPVSSFFGPHSLFRSTKGSFLDTLQQEEETVKSLSR